MKASSSVKVEDGKLVKINLEYDETITQVQLRGDFFLEPPEALNDIENKINGLPVETGREELVEKIEEVDARFIGFKPVHVAEAVEKAFRGEGQ